MPPKRHKRKNRSASQGDSQDLPKTKVLKSSSASVHDNVNADEVDAIVKAIRAKPDWNTKVLDENILKKYKEEAASQHASKASIEAAFSKLTATAIAVAAKFSQQTLKLPGEEEDDDDYRLEYEDQVEGSHSGIRYKDNLVPESLRALLEEQLDAIANAPVKDFHPGTEGKVQDLFHPSLYPYVEGVSYDPSAPAGSIKKAPKQPKKLPWQDEDEDGGYGKKDDADEEDEDEEDKEDEEDDDDDLANFEDMGMDVESERDLRKKIAKLEGWHSIYQWLPAEYQVDEHGDVSIISDINNLDRSLHPELYETLGKVFRFFLPLLKKVIHTKLKGRTLQVITKAANYILKPGEEYDGSWHVEGMRHEHIVASGIYYYSTTPSLKECALAFREKRDNDLDARERTQSWNFNRNIGRVETPMDRCLVFENSLQHKVKEMHNKSSKVVVRKILCFFVVDPNVRIKSTLDIPPQQWDKVKGKVALALCGVIKRLKIEFPPELIKIIVGFAKYGFTPEEALAHRLELMKERKYYVDANNRVWERSFSFCEH